MTQSTLNRHYYKRIGRCPRCNGRNKLMVGENVCPECSVKQYEQSLKRDKDHYNKVHREWSKKSYADCKEQGVCVRCRKKKATIGTRCATCYERDNSARLKREYKPSRFERGLCRWGDNPIEEGFKVCEYHHQIQIERARKKVG